MMPTLTEGIWSTWAGEGAADGQRRLSDAHLALGRDDGHRQFAVDADELEQRQHARLIVGHDFGDVALLVAGHGHEDRLRFVGEVEGAGDDVAVGVDDQAGGRAGAQTEAGGTAGPPLTDGHQLGAALRLDLHHARRDLAHRGLDGLLLQLVEIVRSACAGG